MTDATAKKIGRPTDFTEELANEICMALACSSKGLKRLCKANPHWPNKNTICEWRIKNPAFGDQYARAKEHQVEALVDEILDIADDSSQDYTEGKDGKLVVNSEHINRSRIRIDTRKWLAAKLCPRLYGDKATDAKPGGCESLIEKLHAKNLLDGFSLP